MPLLKRRKTTCKFVLKEVAMWLTEKSQWEWIIIHNLFPVISAQMLSHVWLFATPMDCSTPGLPVLHHLPEFAQTHVHWVSDAIQPSQLLLSPSPPAFNLSHYQDLFQWVSSSLANISWPKYWSFSFSISPCNEYSGLFSFRIDGLDLLAVQGTLKSLLQHHSSKAQFFSFQLSL